MKNKALCLMAGMVALSAMASGCGGGSSSKGTTTTTPTIVVVNGYRGYYNGAVFCDWANNYCGTGLSYGIVLPTIVLLDGYYGYYDGTLFCTSTTTATLASTGASAMTARSATTPTAVA
jgi:hypothetical protein